ncbi:MAG: phosphoenolpyruvate--protein phosphotransferase [Burkholderiales bacterium]|nr:MAG: phosphoenolpyruvate--protein phosphotransferase [Burkholderiales bacterium]
MTFTIRGIAVSSGIAIGRAVMVASGRADVAHYFVDESQVSAELARVKDAKNTVVDELIRLQHTLVMREAKDAPTEIAAMMDVHMMLLQDQTLQDGVMHWITERHYNAEWALATQFEVLARQFDEMEDEYLRERKGDLEQVVERVLKVLQGKPSVLPHVAESQGEDAALVLVAHDLSPADMLQFKDSVFAGFVTDVGGKTSHTAIVARSMDIPAVVGARTASQMISQDDLIIIDGDAGEIVVNPTAETLALYRDRQQIAILEREHLKLLKHTITVTKDGQAVELLANIERPEDTAAAIEAGAVGVGLFRSEFLFMGRDGKLPDEEEQYAAYTMAVKGMQGLPVTIRTVDVGADKPLDAQTSRDQSHLNPALGLRAIRWCLAEPDMFRTQLRAILRAATHGQIHLLIPMLMSAGEIQLALKQIELARDELDQRGVAHGAVKLGAMIEIPAAAIALPLFIKYFDFLSLGTNDLIQYTLAIDRADESVAHLYDPLHPAVLHLIASTIRQCQEAGIGVSVCGEMAGDVSMTRLLLGMGLRCFSMHPSQILSVKREVLASNAAQLAKLAKKVLRSDDPASLLK